MKLLKCSCSGVFFFCCLDFGFFEGGEDENCLIRDKILDKGSLCANVLLKSY